MITIDLSDIAAMIAQNQVEELVQDELEDIATAIFVGLTAPPPMGTPVKTGAARNSWQIDLSDPNAPEVYSQSPYMRRLNDGSSTQSPSGFIDAVVDGVLQ